MPISTLPAMSRLRLGATATRRSAIETAAYIFIMRPRRSSTSPRGTKASSPRA